MDALVTDVHHRSAVAGLRGLGRAGLAVLAVGRTAGAAGLWSRHARGRAVAPSSKREPAEFAAAIGRLAVEHGPLVVYPGTDDSIDPLVDGALPEEAILPFPDNGSVALLRDKRTTLELSVAVGLRSPSTLAEGAAGDLAGSSVPTPCIVKPARAKGPLPATKVETSSQLEALLGSLPADEPMIIQEATTGVLTGIAVVVAKDGTLVARHQQTAERTWPLGAGGSSVAVSVAPDEQLAAKTADLLAQAGYWGLAQAQYIAAAGEPLLIDLNLRFWGTLPLALASGANLPAAWHAVATGAPLPVPGPYKIGVHYRRLEADLLAAHAGSFGLLFERVPRPCTGAMWDPHDPLSAGMLAATALIDRGRQRLRRRAAARASESPFASHAAS